LINKVECSTFGSGGILVFQRREQSIPSMEQSSLESSLQGKDKDSCYLLVKILLTSCCGLHSSIGASWPGHDTRAPSGLTVGDTADSHPGTGPLGSKHGFYQNANYSMT